MKIFNKNKDGAEYSLDRAIAYGLTPDYGMKRKDMVNRYLADLTKILIKNKVIGIEDLKELLKDFNVEED